MNTLSERLTSQFYEWEQRCRGWYSFPVAVDLEPVYIPFHFRYQAYNQQFVDDGKRHTLLSRIASAFQSNPKPQPAPEEEEPYPIATEFECNEPIHAFSISLPKGTKIDIDATEQLLLMLSYCGYPISFEIYGSSTAISFQLVCRTFDKLHVESQVKAFFPECVIKERADLLEEIGGGKGQFASIVHFGLKDEFMRPLKMATNFDPDPLIGLLATMERLHNGEFAVVQVLFQGTANSWTESILRSVTANDGKPFFENSPEMLSCAREKVSSPLFAVVMRVIGIAHSEGSAQHISDMAGSALGRLYFSETNSLISLNPGIDFETNMDACMFRESHLTGMLLNIRELATLVHLPSDTVATAKLERDTRKTKSAPASTEGHQFLLGINEHQGTKKPVTTSVQTRLRHTHLIGATGTGKSTLLHSMIVQDIRKGNGVAVLDPHGDLIESILPYIPDRRHADVIVIDPSDGEYPVGFNILSAHSEIEKEILSSDLVAVFRRLSTSWGDQMNSVFANAILAILESSQGGTLADLRRFLVEKPFRDSYLKTVKDPNVIYYWQKEFPLLKSGSVGSILTRLDTFLRPRLIRNMVIQKKSLDFEHILNTQKILLIKLSQGLIGSENSYLLGTFFVTKIYQAAMARQTQIAVERKDFFLYVDEFQNFITPSMSLILSGTRKYHLGLILAHQDMTQLTKYDSELASSVVSNASTRICFRLGDTDAKRFASGFSYFDASDLENLNTGQAIARIERPEFDFSLDTMPTPEIGEHVAYATTQAILSLSRQTYGTPRIEVEKLAEEQRGEMLEDIEEPLSPPARKEYTHLKQEAEPEEIPITTSPEKILKQKEESHHRYLQALIKKMAEARGYKALIEEPTPDGNGRVDVHLERSGKQIAVEICHTTEPEWEVHNIQKCFDAGYDIIVACSSEKKSLDNIRKLTESTLDASVRSKLLFFEPEAFFQFLDHELAKEASTEVRTKGYRVKVEYSPVSGDQAKQISSSIVKSVAEAAKRKKK